MQQYFVEYYAYESARGIYLIFFLVGDYPEIMVLMTADLQTHKP